jgi:transketolase
MILYYIPKDEFQKVTDLKVLADMHRIQILYMIQNAGSGHIGSAFSAINTMVELFYRDMGPEDVFFSSKGHDCAALYSILLAKGVIPFNEIHNFRRLCGLPGHPDPKWPGIMFHTGSLGMGLSKAQGLAIADRLNGKKRKIYVMTGDGELQEGQNDEAIRNINRRQMDLDIKVIVDGNFRQCDDALIQHYFVDIPHKSIHHPKGNGVSFMEGNNKYHAGALSEEDYKAAVKEICNRIPQNIEYKCVDRAERPFFEKANSLIHAYTDALREIFTKDEKIVLCSADLGKDCGIWEFHESERYIEFGIAEQDMVSAAGGIAKGGFLPIVHSFSAFLCRRANEQIYNNAFEGVKIIYVGALAGKLPPGPGPSHECLADVDLMKTIPGLEILSPKTPEEVKAALNFAVYGTEKSTYIRLACLPGIDGMGIWT